MRRRWPLLVLAWIGIASPALAADPTLAITKSYVVASDPLGLARPRMLPGVEIDYALTVTNPVQDIIRVDLLGLVTLSSDTIGAPTIVEDIPEGLALRVTNYAASGNGGPVEFTDGGTLKLTNSGLRYSFSSLDSTGDGLDFFDGTKWGYVPTPDTSGYDPKVRAIRVTTTGTRMAGLGSFRLRYRARIQ